MVFIGNGNGVLYKNQVQYYNRDLIITSCLVANDEKLYVKQVKCFQSLAIAFAPLITGIKITFTRKKLYGNNTA